MRVKNRILRLVFIGLATLLLSACDLALFDPKGPVGEQAKTLIIVSVALMAVVVIPVLFMIFWFPYRYRKNNQEADYQPDWEHSNKIEAVVWGVPALIIVALAAVAYYTSYSLDPRKELESEQKPLVIQVVALDWKWLFIYPEEQIASVNEISIPVNRPVEFLITSDTVMNSFFVPRLGSQIYAMAGMENRLNLMATSAGSYRGMSANYSGFGFSGMKFRVLAQSEAEYKGWIEEVKQAPQALSSSEWVRLQQKSKDHAVEYFSNVDPLHFKNIIEKYTGVQNGQ